MKKMIALTLTAILLLMSCLPTISLLDVVCSPLLAKLSTPKIASEEVHNTDVRDNTLLAQQAKNTPAPTSNDTAKPESTSNFTTEEEHNTDIKDNNKNTANNDYYPILTSTSNGGMRFNMTLQEFIENYNQLMVEYSTKYSIVDKAFVVGADFKKQNNSKANINGVLSDMYICSSTLFGYNPNIGICVGVEKDSHCISEVSVAIDNNIQQSFSEEQRVLYTIQRHIVYRSLLNELTLESCYNIDDSMQTNSKNGYVPAYFKKGVAFSLDLSYVQSTGISYFRIQPCTKEQWKSAPSFKDIDID